jgi:hypothetical protein
MDQDVESLLAVKYMQYFMFHGLEPGSSSSWELIVIYSGIFDSYWQAQQLLNFIKAKVIDINYQLLIIITNGCTIIMYCWSYLTCICGWWHDMLLAMSS